MSERYTKLFSLANDLYAEGSPAVISAGALLKDNQTGKVLVQLKIKNIGAAVIKAAKVTVQPLDTVGAKLGGEVGYTYLDLNVHRGEEFGQKTLIPLPDKESRGFEVRLTETAFEDNAVWKENGGIWESLPTPKSIDTIGDAELVKQYRIHYGENSSVLPTKVKDLWYCTCGALNREGDLCHVCDRNFAELDIEALKAEMDERLAKEKAEAEERRIAAEKAAKKRKKAFAIGVPIIVVCIVAQIIVTKVIIPNRKYHAAEVLLAGEQYDKAVAAFKELGNYKDSAEQVKNAVSAKLAAVEARVEAEKAEQYESALALMNAGSYDKAITAFEAMKGYKDSENQIENCYIGKYGEEKWNILKNIKAGDTYIFGTYEQDNNTSNGKEEIEWQVLAREDNKILVTSKYALDCQQYNKKYGYTTWEECYLRRWMNKTFLKAAFSEEEQGQIISTDAGSNTTDNVFLLSEHEVEEYFSSDSTRRCKPTDYAVANGAYLKSGNSNCWWWLSSSGYAEGSAVSVCYDGSVYDRGYGVKSTGICVRPALWINLYS